MGYIRYKNHLDDLTQHWSKFTFRQLRDHYNKLNPSWEIPENITIEVHGDVPLGPEDYSKPNLNDIIGDEYTCTIIFLEN